MDLRFSEGICVSVMSPVKQMAATEEYRLKSAGFNGELWILPALEENGLAPVQMVDSSGEIRHIEWETQML